MKTFLTLLFIGSVLLAFGQPYAGNSIPDTEIEKSAGCTPPSTSTYMELNNVRMLVHTAGNMWQVPGQNFSQYEVPKNS